MFPVKTRPNATALLACGALLASTSFAQDRVFHGPLVQWHRDPTSSATFVWVEQLSPDVGLPATWLEGRAGFGYGDGDDATDLSAMRRESTRLYLATRFESPFSGNENPVELVADYDDAFVAYLNGKEIARSANLVGSHVGADVTDGHESGEAETFRVAGPGNPLKRGTNLLAVEVHNVRKSSSDLSFDASLSAGGRQLLPMGATWRYLVATDPEEEWYAGYPELSVPDEVPRTEESSWTLGIRPRGSGSFRSVAIKEKPFGETDDKVFFAQADDLRPGTLYEYVLSAGAAQLRSGWFRTAPATANRPIRFVVGGDMGTKTAVPVNKVAGAQDPLFVLIGGDIAYANGRDANLWFDWIDNWTDQIVAPDGRTIPMIVGIGNHEMKGLRVREKDAPYYFSLFDLPGGRSNFTVDFADYLSVVMLDSNHAQKVESQTPWLGLQLAARQDRTHLFSVYHRPAWGTGIKGNLKDIREHWTPLFEKHGVDCVFENDHHVYKRSHKITGGVRDEENGILHIGDGAWGATLREITPAMINRVGADEYLAEWRSVHHLVLVTANPDGSKRYQAIAADGEIFDEYFDKTPARPQGLLEALAPSNQ